MRPREELQGDAPRVGVHAHQGTTTVRPHRVPAPHIGGRFGKLEADECSEHVRGVCHSWADPGKILVDLHRSSVTYRGCGDGDVAGFSRRVGGYAYRVRVIVTHPIALWVGFVLVHLWLGLLALYAPGQPLGDVTGVYRFWVIEYGMPGYGWVGIDTVWVYPILALVPMLAAAVAGPELYASSWLSLVLVVNAIAFAVVLNLTARVGSRAAAWWWIGFLAALGPIAVGRIDAITVPLAMIGLLVVGTRPALAGALLTAAAWIKVWPAALVATAVVASRQRARIVVGAAGVTAAVVIAGLALGGGVNLLSFLTQQADRGLQIESVIATPWIWDVALDGGGSRIAYDTSILTYQVYGPGVSLATELSTPVLVIVVAVLLGLGVLAVRRGRRMAHVLPPLALAVTVALIVVNKVGSPQFASWLAVPVVAGLVAARHSGIRRFVVPAILSMLIAVLTQGVFPYLYAELLAVHPVMVGILTARNLLYVVLLAWAIAALIRLSRRDAPSLHPLERSVALSGQLWPGLLGPDDPGPGATGVGTSWRGPPLG